MIIQKFEARTLKEKWSVIDEKINELMNKIYAKEIEEYRKKYLKTDPKRFDWIFCISSTDDMLNNEEGEKMIRHFARLVFMIGFDLVKYDNFITDGGSGILVEHFFSELLVVLCEKYRLPYVPPREITIAGGRGSQNRTDAIKNAFNFEKINLTKPTLFITEYTMFAETMEKLFKEIPEMQQADYLSLGVGDGGSTEKLIRQNFGIVEKAKIFSGGHNVYFKGQANRLGYFKEYDNEGAYTNAPLSMSVEKYGDKTEFGRSRTSLKKLAEKLLPIYTLLE